MSDEQHGAPVVRSVERSVAALERTDDAVAFGSQMAALTTAILAVTKNDSHIVLFGPCAGRTLRFVRDVLGRFGVSHTRVPTIDLDALRATLRPETRLVISEVPAATHHVVVDLAALAATCRARNITTLVDSTAATPFNLRPRDHGVDLVCSGARYLAGFSDVRAGFVAGRTPIVSAVRDVRHLSGGALDPHAADLVLRGLKTLPVRISQQNRTAQALAETLEGHPGVKQVWYPGLVSHPSHAVAARLMRGFGGVVSFTLEGDRERASRFLDALSLPQTGPALGGIDAVVAPPEEPAATIRYAVGLEDEDALIADVLRALASG